MSGFVERVIEDWLTNCDERSYQASFVSLLIRSRHRVKYVSKHSTLEFGKDIVSTSPDGELTAYQLKAGNINLAQWREIRGEVYELVEQPVRGPSGRKLRRADRCFLVTTGTIADTVLEQLRACNADYLDKGWPEIETIDLYGLIRRFVDAFAEFVPASLGSFSELVRIYLSDGKGPIDKELLSSVLKGLLPAREHGKKKMSRALSNLVVAAEFSSTPFRLTNNHISVIDVWTLAACRITSTARRFNLRGSQWLPWLDLCHTAIDAAGSRLLDEIHGREDYIEGDLLTDMLVLQYRTTVALGYAAAVTNSRSIEGLDTREEGRNLLATVMKHFPSMRIWGEGSWNYYFNIAIALSTSPKGELAAITMMVSWLKLICSKQALAPPYLTVESALSPDTSEDRDRQERVPAFYSLGSATDLLSRKMWRQTLAPLWPGISKREFAELVPDATADHFEWMIEEATLEVRQLPMRVSWGELRHESFEQRSELFTDEDAWLLPYMLCCYPHRVSRKLSGELHYRTGSEAAKREWAR